MANIWCPYLARPHKSFTPISPKDESTMRDYTAWVEDMAAADMRAVTYLMTKVAVYSLCHLLIKSNTNEKIPQTGDKESLDRCK